MALGAIANEGKGVVLEVVLKEPQLVGGFGISITEVM